MSDRTPARRTTYDREGTGLEFDRVAFFSDAIFAIAMTLLIIDVGVPALDRGDDAGSLARAIDARLPGIIAFFIGFVVLGFYWRAHHSAFGRLARVDGTYAGINLVYLAFVAFLPFPTGLLGEYIENPVAVLVFAGAAAAVSAMEVVTMTYAWRNGLLREQWPVAVFRYGAVMSSVPVVLFVLSMPIAFVSPILAMCVWILAVPAGVIGSRFAPAGLDQFS